MTTKVIEYIEDYTRMVFYLLNLLFLIGIQQNVNKKERDKNDLFKQKENNKERMYDLYPMKLNTNVQIDR